MRNVFSLLVLAVATFFCHTRVVAQKGALEAGPVGGLNLATTTEDVQGGSSSARSTYHLGAVVRYWIAQQVALQAYLLYNNKGVVQEFTDPSNVFSWKFQEKLAYLSVPLAALYRLQLSQAMALGILAGPEFSFLLSAKSRYEETYLGTAIPAVETDEKADLKAFELGLIFGALLEHNFSNLKVFLAYQYGLGLTKIHKDSQFDSKNRVHMFTLGLVFGLH
jgi:outer membrane immunogenic protein